MISIRKIISGGQTGVDRAALDAALTNDIEIGGYVPRGRLAEDGRIPERYTGLIETNSENYSERTHLNVVNSDATLVLTNGEPVGGSKLTADLAAEYQKPLLHIDIGSSESKELLAAALEWIQEVRPAVLNIAGPRASEEPAIYGPAFELLNNVIKKAGRKRPA